jgi:hypothetical protein
MNKLKFCCLHSVGLLTQSTTQQNRDTGLSVTLSQSKVSRSGSGDFHRVTSPEDVRHQHRGAVLVTRGLESRVIGTRKLVKPGANISYRDMTCVIQKENTQKAFIFTAYPNHDALACAKHEQLVQSFRVRVLRLMVYPYRGI